MLVKIFTNIRIFLHQHPKLIRQHASPTYMKISVFTNIPFTNMRNLFTNIPEIPHQHNFFHQHISPTSLHSSSYIRLQHLAKRANVSECDTSQFKFELLGNCKVLHFKALEIETSLMQLNLDQVLHSNVAQEKIK